MQFLNNKFNLLMFNILLYYCLLQNVKGKYPQVPIFNNHYKRTSEILQLIYLLCLGK